jgi:uncharacterized protein with HEPN domain
LRSDRERLLDILESVERIEAQTVRGRDAFADDELAQTAVIRWVEIIGEAARGVSEELREAHPEVPWRQMVAMRNVLIHGYDELS